MKTRAIMDAKTLLDAERFLDTDRDEPSEGMTNPHFDPEAGAWSYEAGRLFRRADDRHASPGAEWVPSGAALFNAVAILAPVMVFSGLTIWWEWPETVFVAALLPLFAAKWAWRERNPLVRESPVRFMAFMGYSRTTWYRASLALGLILALLIGAALAGALLLVYAFGREGIPWDRDLLLELLALPLISGLFFLIHFRLETRRRVRRLRVTGQRSRLKRAEDRDRASRGLGMLLGGFAFLTAGLLAAGDHCALPHLRILIFFIGLAALALVLLGSVVMEGRESRIYLHPLFLSASMGVYAFCLYGLPYVGGRPPFGAILTWAAWMRPLPGTILLASFFLALLAWTWRSAEHLEGPDGTPFTGREDRS